MVQNNFKEKKTHKIFDEKRKRKRKNDAGKENEIITIKSLKYLS